MLVAPVTSADPPVIVRVILLVAFVAVPVLAAVLWSWQARRGRLARVSTRQSLSPRAFFDEYYGDSALGSEEVGAAIKEVSAVLGVPAGVIRPSDRFDTELAPARGWEFDDSAIELAWRLELMAKERGVSVDLVHIRTVDDFVRCYCRLLPRVPSAEEEPVGM